jgi:hypothetical protein
MMQLTSPWWAVVALAATGGLLNRARGGGFVSLGSTTLARIVFWAVPTAGSLMAMLDPTATPRATLGIGMVLFVGCYLSLALGWADHMDLGRVPHRDDGWLAGALDVLFGEDSGHDFWREFFGLMVRGLLFTTAIGAAVVLADLISGVPLWRGWWFAVTGAGMPLMYELGWRTPRLSDTFDRGPCWGEFWFGAWVWGWMTVAYGGHL